MGRPSGPGRARSEGGGGRRRAGVRLSFRACPCPAGRLRPARPGRRRPGRQGPLPDARSLHGRCPEGADSRLAGRSRGGHPQPAFASGEGGGMEGAPRGAGEPRRRAALGPAGPPRRARASSSSMTNTTIPTPSRRASSTTRAAAPASGPRVEKAVVVFGSVTPSVEAYHEAREDRDPDSLGRPGPALPDEHRGRPRGERGPVTRRARAAEGPARSR